MAAAKYSAESLQVLSGLEPVRRRPGMYTDTTRPTHLHNKPHFTSMVTSEGGNQPLWAPDGSELYYRNGAAMMSIPIRTQPEFRAGSPVQLFEGDFLNQDNPRREYDLEYPEGHRFLMVEEFEPEVANTKLVFVENWGEELKKLVPVN